MELLDVILMSSNTEMKISETHAILSWFRIVHDRLIDQETFRLPSSADYWNPFSLSWGYDHWQVFVTADVPAVRY